MRGKRAREERAAFDAEFDTDVKAARRQVVFKQPAPELQPFELKNEMSDLDYRQYIDHIASTVIDQLRAEGLTDADLTQLDRLLTAQKQLDLSSPEVWKVCVALLTDLGFIKQTVAAPAAPVDELENISTLTREGNKQLKKAAFDQMLVEAQPLFAEFKTHMAQVWDVNMTPKQCSEVIHFCVDRNLGLNAKAYDVARRVVLKCLTQDELLQEHIENSDLSNYHVKRDIATQINRMKQPAV